MPLMIDHASRVTARYECMHQQTGLSVTAIETTSYHDLRNDDTGYSKRVPQLKELETEAGQICTDVELEGDELRAFKVITPLGSVRMIVIRSHFPPAPQ